MLPVDEHDAEELVVPSELSQPLEALCSALADDLIARSTRFEEINARFGAMLGVVTRTIRNSSRQWNNWNSSHDYLRVLPVELQAKCWSYLPQSDLVGLACVCSSWRDLSRGIPSLWTTLKVDGPVTGTDVVFARSGRLHFDVSVTAYSWRELAYVDDCVRNHAERVRTLCIALWNAGFSDSGPADKLFLYPAPILAHFSFRLPEQLNYGLFHLSSEIFNCHAPNLRSLTLHEMPFPTGCPAFALLTELDLRWGLDIPSSGLEHIFAVCPFVETLSLSNIRDILSLPFLPKPSKLRKIALSADALSFPILLARGYLDINRLEVVSHDPEVLFHGAMHDGPSLHATLSIASTRLGASELVLRSAHGPVAVFTAEDDGGRTPAAILERASSFRALQRLVLPSAAPYYSTVRLPGGDRPQHPYLPNDLHLPALRTLGLSHGTYHFASLFDAATLCGVIRAPRLSRLEIIRAGRRVYSINPGHLAIFIEQHIECDDPAALEVFVSAEEIDLLDVADEEGMARLRRCVGKIVYGDSTS